MQLTPSRPHRVVIGRVRAVRTARRLTGRMLASPVLRWRYGAPVADRLLFEPTDFRPGDPVQATALDDSALLLGGEIVDLTGPSPFDQPHLSAPARGELTGFGWLRHLAAARTLEAQAHARRLVRAWIRHAKRERLERCPATSDDGARRMIAWLAAAQFIVAGADDDIHDLLLDSLADQRLRLAAHWRAAGPESRLRARIAMALYDTVIAGRDGRLDRSLVCLETELANQLRPGGHVMRCGALLVEIGFDLLTLHHALIGVGRPPVPAVRSAFLDIADAITHRRLGDGDLTRLQLGSPLGRADYEVLLDRAATMSGRPERSAAAPAETRDGLLRVERGRSTLVLDVGPAPPLAYATRATASCLAFELADGPHRIIGSCPLKAAGPTADGEHRATRRHATLVLGGQSSGTFVDLGGDGMGYAVTGPGRVRVDVLSTSTGAVTVDAAHDGYCAAFGLEHRRLMTIDATGHVLDGLDDLLPARSVDAAGAVPFAIQFHIEPALDVAHLPADGAVELAGPGGTWRFSVTSGATLGVEADPGRDPVFRIVLRGRAAGRTTIAWRLERLPDRLADPAPSSISGS